MLLLVDTCIEQKTLGGRARGLCQALIASLDTRQQAQVFWPGLTQATARRGRSRMQIRNASDHNEALTLLPSPPTEHSHGVGMLRRTSDAAHAGAGVHLAVRHTMSMIYMAIIETLLKPQTCASPAARCCSACTSDVHNSIGVHPHSCRNFGTDLSATGVQRDDYGGACVIQVALCGGAGEAQQCRKGSGGHADSAARIVPRQCSGASFPARTPEQPGRKTQTGARRF